MLGEATLHYAHARFKEAILVLTEVVMFNPCLPDTYHTLGLVYDTIGNAEKAAGFYELAAEKNPKDSILWNSFVPILLQQTRENREQILVISLRDFILRRSILSLKIDRAALSYGEIVQLCPENVEALKTGAKVSP